MKKIAAAFTGQSNSGKTTLIVKLSEYLQQKGYKVCIIKHDPKDKAIFDKEGKDSHKFSSTGADVAVVSPTRTTLFKQQPSEIDDIVDMFGEFDYLLVEGLKTLPFPRICVQRGSLNSDYFEVSDAIATDDSIDPKDIPKDSQHLDLNNIEQIIDWIDNNGKRYEPHPSR
jgi:molybdopterin-guanine dinucleotide biosynthesis adapter protein